MLERLHFETREAWLAARERGIGCSEVSAIVGMNPWQTPLDLWKLKIGSAPPKDLSDNPAVAQGVMMEPILRQFFTALHPEYAVEHYPYDMLFQTERPYWYATLDGELTRLSDGKRGILEIKDSTPNGKTGWEKWNNGRLPDYYYVQTLSQLFVTGWDFVILFAALHSMNGDITLREYEIELDDGGTREDIAWLAPQVTRFWEYNVQHGIMPAQKLIL